MIRRLWPALAAAALLGAAPAAAAPDPFERTAASLKALTMADPAAALPRILAARRDAARLPPQARGVAIATTQWLEGEAHLRMDRIDLAEPLIEQANASVDRIAPVSRLKGDLLLSRGGLHMARARVARALADFQAAFGIYQRIGDTRAQAIALLNIAFLYAEAKDYEGVLRYSSQARRLYHGDPPVQLSVYNNRADALKELGRYAEAEAQFREALVLARRMNSPLLEAQVLRNIARTQLLAGDRAAAERTMAEGYARSARAGPADLRTTLALNARIAFERGRTAEAAALIARYFDGVDLSSTQLSSREAHQTAYRIAAARHDSAGALAHLAALKRLDDEATKLATTTSTALMAARFDYANQELRIANLQRDEARRSVAFERARLASERTLFLGGTLAVTVIIALLSIGLFTIRRSRNKVRAVAADLTVTNAALGKALAAKTEFLATTSHEIRTPLNGILGMTQVMLADARLAADTRDRVGIVHAAGVTMRALVDDILDVAKMETGNLTLEDAPFDLRATLSDAARLWEHQCAAKAVAFVADLDRCPTMVEGDAARVRQVAFNLLSNAVKFTRGGEVGMRAERVGDQIVLEVRDTGVGIPADKLEDIFESFRQADTATTRQFGGTGLGLAICRNLVEAMGGTIGVASAIGEGSVFTVTLPYRPAAEIAVTTTEGEGRALMLVDRNPIARAMLRTLFAVRAERVELGGSAEEAQARVAQGRVNTILIDGATLTADAAAMTALRGAAQAAGVPVVVLCADQLTADGLAERGWTTIARPIAATALVERVLQFVTSNTDALAVNAA